MPGKTDLSELNCSLARTLEIVGDWWTLLIIRDAVLGVRRFGEFQKSLGIAKNKPPVIVNDTQGRPVAPVKLRGRSGDLEVQTIRFSPGPGATARTRAFFDALSAAERRRVAR